MQALKYLYLKDFRNYKSECFEFSPHINSIIGDNAQGKTNLLEAIYLLITGRSFRTPHLADLPLFGTSAFYIEAQFEKSGVMQTLKMHYSDKERLIFLNQTPIPMLSSLFGILLGVILTPEDRALVMGQPHERRQFLNIHIAQSNPFYLYHFRRYERALKQRNALLKQRKIDSIEVWEEQMALSGTYLAKEREKVTQEIETISSSIQKLLSFDESLQVEYKSSFTNEERFLQLLAKNREREIQFGHTLIGPHKDDLLIHLNQKPAKYFASEGQKRGIVVSLRLAQAYLLKEKTGEVPLFCVDDMGVFLDAKREKKFISLLMELGQVFLTSPRELSTEIPSHIISININKDKVLRT